jgi:glyoxylase-like metal-dependent hydrolase (beta-lactamase superfamily II)
MILERSMHPRWLSNTYLVAAAPGGDAVLIDSGGPLEPLLAAIEHQRLTVTHVLCTHHHHDHVAHNDALRERFGCRIAGHGAERQLFGQLDLELEDGQEIRCGDLALRALHIPGHTVGQLAFVIEGRAVFTGDTLFRGSVGGTRAPGHATFDDLRRSIMDVLMRLPHALAVHPGHTEATSIGEEWEQNPFIRVWRGVEEPGTAGCSVDGEPATLVVRARDYDGGTKCWVRFDAGGVDDVVPGSRVVAGPASSGRD